MSEQSFFKNLKQWEIVCPYGADLLQGIESVNFPNDLVLKSISDNDNLSYETRYKDIDRSNLYIHSEIDPLKEAQDAFSRLQLKNVKVLYVYGVGLGYFYEAASAWLKESADRILIFLEDDIQVIRHFLKTENASKILFDHQVFLYFIGDENLRIHLLGSITFNFADSNFLVTGLDSYLRTKSQNFTDLAKEIAFFDIIHRAWKIDSVTAYGMLFFRNYVPNFFQLPSSYFGDGFKDKFKGIPAIICGAGPSLDKNIDILATLSDKAIIIAGGTALNALNAKGVMPHFGAGIDPNFGQYTRLIMNHAYHIPFIYRARMFPEGLNLVHGDKIYISSSYIHQGAKWLENKLQIFGLNIPEGFNVLNFSTSLANVMGCNPIICVGIDLAYSQGGSYASGIQSHAIHNKSQDFRTKDSGEELLTKPDIYGNPVYTLWKWVAESAWYSSFSASNSHLKLINATEGGIGFNDVENMPLSEVKKRYLNKSYDIESLIHGEIQNSKLPKTCNKNNIQDLFSKMLKNLEESEKIIGDIVEHYEIYTSNGSDSDKAQAELLEKQFKETEIFEGFYKEFSDSYSSLMALRQTQLRRDSYRAEGLQDKAFAAIELEKYAFFKNVTNSGISCLKSTLEQEKETQFQNIKPESHEKLLLDIARDLRFYKFEKDLFQIVDKELDIHYIEDLSKSTPLNYETLYYPSGRLKIESYYKNEALHGPVTYFSEDNHVLSKTWFIEGKRTGVAVRRYLSEALYSVQYYKNGQKVGVHRYYFEPGNLRSVLPYKNGLLNGEVRLFHANGNIFRRLNFIDDRRSGKEELFDEKGKLVTESYYQNDQPVGSTKVWHNNGVLAKEIIYDKDSKAKETKSWDQNGEFIAPLIESDYFDEMAEKTSVITNGLEKVVEKLSVVAKIYDGTIDQDDKKFDIQNSLADSLKDIQEKLELFKQVENQLKTENEQNSSNEAIWKTPETKQAVSQEIDKMSENMAREMKAIQEGMKKIMEELKKKTDAN